MKTSQVFLRAKRLLSVTGYDGEYRYICFAIDAVKCPLNNKQAAKTIITNLLEGYTSLGGWLEYKHGIMNDRYDEKVQETRHAWLDHLIEHYESIGD